MIRFIPRNAWSMALLLCSLFSPIYADAEPIELQVRPSATDPRISSADWPHVITFKKDNRSGQLLLWLPGTGGKPLSGPRRNFPMFAVQQGYRVVQLSYITDEAVAQICVNKNLKTDPECAANFRRKRLYGDATVNWVNDEPQDAIVNRLTKLLVHLRENRKDEGWEQYLDNGNPRWERIAVAGQSQGGGMAAYLAKEKRVARVIMLSGGWDMSGEREIAHWYSRRSSTPLDRWYASYHVLEPQARTMAEIYQALGIPQGHVGALDLPVRGPMPHTEGVNNPDYLPWWKQALR